MTLESQFVNTILKSLHGSTTFAVVAVVSSNNMRR